MLKKTLKRLFPGVAWQHPVINAAFRAIDPFDWAVRAAAGRGALPPYSIRVRSNGINRQFGGANFARFGNQLAEHLTTHAGLRHDSDVLEIGCGCGRTAFALADVLDDGRFTGMDIEKASLESCRSRPLFRRKNFRFDFLDVHNDEYNPDGKNRADSYRFPYDDASFDVIYLVSVFTHMLTDDVTNYIGEIGRMLKPDGACMVTTFLVDRGRETGGLSFPAKSQEHYYYDAAMPEVAVGYELEFFQRRFADAGLRQSRDVLWGSWRQSPQVESHSGFAQDILFFRKG